MEGSYEMELQGMELQGTELQDAREEIRQIDEEMARLLERRMEAVRKVAAYKLKRGLPILDKEQEAKVLEGRSAHIKNPALQPFYREFLQETMEISKRWQVYLIQRKQDGIEC